LHNYGSAQNDVRVEFLLSDEFKLCEM
jgi:hypothetical protein